MPIPINRTRNKNGRIRKKRSDVGKKRRGEENNMTNIIGAVVVATGFSRGSGYDELILKMTDGEFIKLHVETTSDDDTCIGMYNIKKSLMKAISDNKEKIKEFEEKLEEIETW